MERLVPDSNQVVIGIDPHCFCDLAFIIVQQCRGIKPGQIRHAAVLPFPLKMPQDPVDPRTPCMESVKTHFMHDKQEDHHTDCNADGQPEDIDSGKGFILYQVPPGDLNIISDHNIECE